MSIEQLLDDVRRFPDVLVLSPGPGDGTPEIAWGDHFFYHSPDGTVPTDEQPYATIVTKNYPGDELSRLDDPGRWRVNIHVLRAEFGELTGQDTRHITTTDYATADVVVPHPVYGPQGLISVVVPGERTLPLVRRLLHEAHDRAVRRHGGDRPGGSDR
jgi:hypothetical protein